MPAESNPRLMFERMFGAGAARRRARPTPERRMQARRSVLGFRQ